MPFIGPLWMFRICRGDVGIAPYSWVCQLLLVGR